MAIKGQLMELRNEGRYQFLLKVGIYDDALPGQAYLFPEEEEAGVPLDKNLKIYECQLDFSDAEKPVSYPLGDLIPCMELYEKNETPEGLNADDERLWKIAFVVDTILAEAFATDVLEVIHGDEFEEIPPEAREWTGNPGETAPPPQPPPMDNPAMPARTSIRCPDCGAEAKVIVNTQKGKVPTYACEVCGRYFEL